MGYYVLSESSSLLDVVAAKFLRPHVSDTPSIWPEPTVRLLATGCNDEDEEVTAIAQFTTE